VSRPRRPPAAKPKARAKPKPRSTTKTSSPPARPRGVAAAVRRDLQALDERLAGSALAATAIALGREIDRAGNSPTEKATCARALTEVMIRLRELQGPDPAPDRLDDLEARRAKRIGARAAKK
jgi:hypothetical protein